MGSREIAPSVPKERNYQIDNIRFFLIMITVFAHLLELITGERGKMVYQIIYSFHMPAFIFISGLFAKFSPKKFLKHLVIPYFVFQILYILFEKYVANPGADIAIQFVTPHWLMWFLLSLIIYYLLLPVIDTDRIPVMIAVVAGGLVAAILVGFDESLGRTLALARTVVYFPFFAAGVYIGKPKVKEKIRSIKKPVKIAVTACAVPAMIACEWAIRGMDLRNKAFYGSYEYARTHSQWYSRALILLAAILWLVILFGLFPRKKIPVISWLGQSTMTVYLLHGFIKLYLQKTGWLASFSGITPYLIAAGLTAAIVVVFNLPPVRFVFRKLF